MSWRRDKGDELHDALRQNKKELDILATGLIEYETLSGEEVNALLKGKKIREDEKKISTKKPRLTVPEVK